MRVIESDGTIIECTPEEYAIYKNKNETFSSIDTAQTKVLDDVSGEYITTEELSKELYKRYNQLPKPIYTCTHNCSKHGGNNDTVTKTTQDTNPCFGAEIFKPQNIINNSIKHGIGKRGKDYSTKELLIIAHNTPVDAARMLGRTINSIYNARTDHGMSNGAHLKSTPEKIKFISKQSQKYINEGHNISESDIMARKDYKTLKSKDKGLITTIHKAY